MHKSGESLRIYQVERILRYCNTRSCMICRAERHDYCKPHAAFVTIKNIPFQPRLIETLKGYSMKDFTPDLIAGITVGIVALPLAMAFAIASGVKPEAGIFTAVIAGFIISERGGSRVSIGGLTGALVVIIYGIGHQYRQNTLLIG